MSCPGCRPPASEYRRFFGRKFAGHDVRRYRKKGLPKTARGLVASAGDGSVLDIGGGIGTIALELVESGAPRATVVEVSDGYDEAAAELAGEHDVSGRIERRVGDFVTESDLVEPHDVVVLHRVVCCYPDVDALVSRAASHAGARLLLTYPRERALNRLAFRAANGWFWLTRCGLRTFVHPVTAIAAAAEREGLALRSREAEGMIWENAVFERASAG